MLKKYKNKIIFHYFFVFVFVFEFLSASKGQTFEIDETFGSKGTEWVLENSDHRDQRSWDITIQKDQKIIVSTTTDGNFLIYRLMPNGMIDSSYGNFGCSMVDFGSPNDFCNSIIIQEDGKAIVCGYTNGDCSLAFAVARITENGLLDTTFNHTGKFVLDDSDYAEVANSLTIQEDGKILVTGWKFVNEIKYYDAIILRLNNNGERDSTFGFNSIFQFDLNNSNDKAYHTIVKANGNILVVCSSDANDLLLTLNNEGKLDSTWNQIGLILHKSNNNKILVGGVAMEKDDKIIISGIAEKNGLKEIYLKRYLADGIIDSTFHKDGLVNLLQGIDINIGRKVLIQDNGKIILSGAFYKNQQINSVLIRIESNGNPDNSFGESGIFLVKHFYSNVGSSIAVQFDNKLILSGFLNLDYFNAITYINRYTGITTGIKQIETENRIKIFPNPTHSSFSLSGIDNYYIKYIHLYSIQGTRIKEYDPTLTSFPLGDIASGIYLLEVIHSDGQRELLKLVKN